MNKALAILIFCFSIVDITIAQDVIVMIDGTSINGKVTEITETAVKYQQQGAEQPIVIVGTDKVESIIFSNGSVKVFEHTEEPKPTYAGQPNYNYIDKFSDHYFMGDKRMSKEEYLTFLKQHCPEAYYSHESGVKLAKAGWVCFGTGAAIGVVGSTLWGKFFNSDEGWYWGDYADGDKEKVLAGVALTSVGAALLTVSVPLLSVGYAKQSKSHVIYNNYCAKQSTPVALTLKAKTDGMAVAINF